MIEAPALFLRERISDCWDQALPLIYANQRETGTFDPDQFLPNPEFYFMQEERGIVRLFTMRHGGKLTGYQVFFCSHHPRYPQIACAIQDVMYVAPEHRGVASLRFLKFADGILEGDGMKPMRHASAKNLAFARLLEHCGYQLLEQTFMKA